VLLRPRQAWLLQTRLLRFRSGNPRQRQHRGKNRRNRHPRRFRHREFEMGTGHWRIGY
jgi:hypothetical protein